MGGLNDVIGILLCIEEEGLLCIEVEEDSIFSLVIMVYFI